MRILTQEILMKSYHYNPDTGEFTRKLKILGDVTGKPQCWIDKHNKRFCNKKPGFLSHSGYWMVHINGKTYPFHRLAFLYMEGYLPGGYVDHINHNRLDNRWENLRIVQWRDNYTNMALRKSNTHGIPGLLFEKKWGLWSAYIGHNRKRVYLGCSKDYFEICCIRKSAEIKYNYHPNHGRANAV